MSTSTGPDVQSDTPRALRFSCELQDGILDGDTCRLDILPPESSLNWLGPASRWRDAIHPEDFAVFLDLMGKALAQGDTFSVVCRIMSGGAAPVLSAVLGSTRLAPDGKARLLEGSISPLSGAIACTGCSEAVIQAEKKAKELSRHILSILSHDIRSPLIGVIGMLQLLRRSGLSDRQMDYVTMASDSCECILEMAKNILDFAKIDSGKDMLCLKGMNIPSVADSVLRLHQEQAARKLVRLTMDHAEDFPRDLLCDETKFRQVLGNLVSNAIKFSESGEVRVMATYAVTPGKGFVVILEVADNGVGFDVGQTAIMFDQFGQLCRDSESRGLGAGLGLTIVKGLVELFGGCICVDSRPGEGSSFLVSFPASPAPL